MNRNERQAQLFDLFVGGLTGTDDIAIMSLAMMTSQIHRARAGNPDNIQMTDAMIASAILEYARTDQEHYQP